MLERKELFKNTLRKTAHAWKTIIDLRLSGMSSFLVILLYLYNSLAAHSQVTFVFFLYFQSLIAILIIAEEEASRLRFYIDEPAYTDLHWVHSNS